MTSYVFLWEEPDGKRCWEAVREDQYAGFLEQLLNRGVNPATVMVAYARYFFTGFGRSSIGGFLM